ncbi:hypothetical protein DM01DRAFT_1386762 [Hesseltinella vesiculosa]|uniref:TOG domain-containing protein n=1 Tax=Hesseltinella vesiculosa TaxID=101127 RepID=A0A1X2G4F4_9FUNG|nr:hypothetical protein DM01DRAFT_1386762 [Hesseltinella vesiculosa]
MHKSQLAKAITVTSVKALERELSSAAKVFQGKETEHNWDQRERFLLLLSSAFHQEPLEEWRSCLVQNVHDLVLGIADATKSLRTKYAFVAFDLIATIGKHIGPSLDGYTLETMVLALLQTSSSSKYIVANKAKDTMLVLLSTTTYHNKILSLFCTKFDDRNPQVRQFIATFIRTYFQVHTRLAHVRANMQRLVPAIDAFLKASLVDPTPAVRDQARHVFWLYRRHWSPRTDKLLQQLDPGSRRSLEKWIAALIKDDLVLGKRKTDVTPSSQPVARPADARPGLLRRIKSDSQLPKEEDEPVRRPHTHTTGSTAPLASATLLHMLRSPDPSTNVHALRTLAHRLLTVQTTTSSLPSTVPSRVDLLPVLWDYLSPTRFHGDLRKQLMTWDCLVTVFAKVFSLPHYAPTLILASHQHRSCAVGLRRLKHFYKRRDPQLVKTLLTILLMTTYAGGSGLQDRNAKKLVGGLGGDADSRNLVTDGLVLWIDNILCDYVGLDVSDTLTDDDQDDQQEDGDQQPSPGAALYANLKKNQATALVATAWFDDDAHMEECLEAALRLFRSQALCAVHLDHLLALIGRLRLANQRVFDLVLEQDSDTAQLLQRMLGHPLSLATTEPASSPSNASDSPVHGQDDTTSPLLEAMMANDTTLSVHTCSPPPSYDDILRHDASHAQPSPSPPPGPAGPGQSPAQPGPSGASLSSDGDDALDLQASMLDSHSPLLMQEAPLASLVEDSPREATSARVDEGQRRKQRRDGSPAQAEASTQHTPRPQWLGVADPNSGVQLRQDHVVVPPTTILNDSTMPNVPVSPVDQLYSLLRAMRTVGHKQPYDQLMMLCKTHSFKTRPHDQPSPWTQLIPDTEDSTTLFMYALDTSVNLGQALHARQDSDRMAWFRWLQCFFEHQHDLFQTLQDLTALDSLVMGMILMKREQFHQMSLMVDSLLETIFLTILDGDQDLALLESLIDQVRPPGTTSNHPECTILLLITRVVSRWTAKVLAQRLKTSLWMDFIMQSFNHSSVAVRQACVKALVKIDHQLGKDQDIKTFFPDLRDEQRHLLDYYIRH